MTVLIDLDSNGEVIKIKEEKWTTFTFDMPPRFTAHSQADIKQEYQRKIAEAMEKVHKGNWNWWTSDFGR